MVGQVHLFSKEQIRQWKAKTTLLLARISRNNFTLYIEENDSVVKYVLQRSFEIKDWLYVLTVTKARETLKA